jgi:hypothetical protein
MPDMVPRRREPLPRPRCRPDRDAWLTFGLTLDRPCDAEPTGDGVLVLPMVQCRQALGQSDGKLAYAGLRDRRPVPELTLPRDPSAPEPSRQPAVGTREVTTSKRDRHVRRFYDSWGHRRRFARNLWSHHGSLWRLLKNRPPTLKAARYYSADQARREAANQDIRPIRANRAICASTGARKCALLFPFETAQSRTISLLSAWFADSPGCGCWAISRSR